MSSPFVPSNRKPARLVGRLILATCALLAFAAGAAYAVIPDSNGVIHGCRKDNSGSLRVIDSDSSACTQAEQSLDWNQRGPAGPAGPQGPQGPRGPSAAFVATRATGAYVQVPVEMDSIAHVDLPAGKYVILANASLSDNSGDFRVVRCVLGDIANSDFGEAVADFANVPYTSTSRIPVALTWSHEFGTEGQVHLSCAVDFPAGLSTSNVFARSIRLTAIQVDQLQLQPQ